MTRRPSGVLARRFALALSLMLIGSMLALPAIATDDPPNGIIAPSGDDAFAIGEQLHLEAFEADATSVQWAVRLGSPAPNNPGTVAGNVDGQNDPSHLDNGRFTATVSTAGWVPSDEYFFVFNPSPGGRYVVQFEIVDAFAEFGEGEVVTCEVEDDECTIEQGGFTVSTDARGKDGQSAFLGLRVVDSGPDGDAIAQAVSAACDAELAEVHPAGRFGPGVINIVPLNFEKGSITVQSTIPRSFVNASTARGAGIFQVCVAAETADYAGYTGLDPIMGTNDLFGPIILDRCDAADAKAACVLHKFKENGNVGLEYQLPTADPWAK